MDLIDGLVRTSTTSFLILFLTVRLSKKTEKENEKISVSRLATTSKDYGDGLFDLSIG